MWQEVKIGVRGYTIWCQNYNCVRIMLFCGWSLPAVSTKVTVISKTLPFLQNLFMISFYFILFYFIYFLGHFILFLIQNCGLGRPFWSDKEFAVLLLAAQIMRDGVAFRRIFTYSKLSSGWWVLINTWRNTSKSRVLTKLMEINGASGGGIKVDLAATWKSKRDGNLLWGI